MPQLGLANRHNSASAARVTVHALIVAAGKGIRAGGDTPKQYRPVAGKALLRHAVEGLLAHPGIDAVTVIINPDDRPLYEAAIAGLALPPPAPLFRKIELPAS